MATCATCSVSGRGTNTPGPTSNSSARNGARPVMCCSGSRVALRPTSARIAAASACPSGVRRMPAACT